MQRVWTDGELAEKRSKVKEVRLLRLHRSARPATLKLPASCGVKQALDYYQSMPTEAELVKARSLRAPVASARC